MVELSKESFLRSGSDPIVIRNLWVQFPGMQEREVPIGEIRLHLGDAKSNLLVPQSSGAASGPEMSKGFVGFELKQPAKVIGFQIPAIGQIENQIQLKVNQTVWTNQPLPVQAGTDLQVEYLLPKQTLNVYSFDAQVLFEKTDGSKETGTFRITSQPPYTEEQMWAIVQAGRE